MTEKLLDAGACQADQAEREEEARRLAQEALKRREDEAAARRWSCLCISVMITAVHLPDLRRGEPHVCTFSTSTDMRPPV